MCTNGSPIFKITFKRILAPWDFSAHGRKGIETAQYLAQEYKSSLLIVHVIEPVFYPVDLGYAPALTDEMMQQIQQEAKEELTTLVEHISQLGIPAEFQLRIGRPYLEICQAAKDWKADLIVITTHGHTGLKHVLLGSTAERVVRYAPCPTLVIRAEQSQ